MSIQELHAFYRRRFYHDWRWVVSEDGKNVKQYEFALYTDPNQPQEAMTPDGTGLLQIKHDGSLWIECKPVEAPVKFVRIGALGSSWGHNTIVDENLEPWLVHNGYLMKLPWPKGERVLNQMDFTSEVVVCESGKVIFFQFGDAKGNYVSMEKITYQYLDSIPNISLMCQNGPGKVVFTKEGNVYYAYLRRRPDGQGTDWEIQNKFQTTENIIFTMICFGRDSVIALNDKGELFEVLADRLDKLSMPEPVVVLAQQASNFNGSLFALTRDLHILDLNGRRIA